MSTSRESKRDEAVGEKIKKQRTKKGISQQALVVGKYSEPYLSRVERGQIQPSQEFLEFIANRLGLESVAELLETPLDGEEIEFTREEQEIELFNAQLTLLAKEYDKAKNILLTSNQLVTKNLPPELLARYLHILGEVELNLGDYKAAIVDLQRALKLFEQVSAFSPLEIEQVRDCLALTYYRQGNVVLALETHQGCQEAVRAGKITDVWFKMRLYYNIANEYQVNGQREQAFELYREASQLAEQMETQTDLANIYWNMGIAYRDKGDLELAKNYLNRSASIYKSLEELNLIVVVKNIAGITLIEDKKFQEAEQILLTALKTAEQLSNAPTEGSIYITLAHLYYTEGNFEKAFEIANVGLEKAHKAENKIILGQGLAQLAEIQLARGVIDEGVTRFEEALAILEEDKATDYLRRISFRYATALEKIGQQAEALKMYRRAYLYQDSSLNR